MHRAEEKKKGEETASVDVSKQPQLKEETITATPLPSTTETTLAAEAAERQYEKAAKTKSYLRPAFLRGL